MDKQLVTCVFLDFSKAFDTVNHNILLSKLYHNGIRGTPFKRFENYLSNRNQFVKIGDTKSNWELLLVEYYKDQPCVHYYFCYILMTCLIALISYPLEYLLMIQICFIQVLIYNTLNLL